MHMQYAVSMREGWQLHMPPPPPTAKPVELDYTPPPATHMSSSASATSAASLHLPSHPCPSAPAFTCLICHLSFPSRNRLHLHLRSHSPHTTTPTLTPSEALIIARAAPTTPLHSPSAFLIPAPFHHILQNALMPCDALLPTLMRPLRHPVLFSTVSCGSLYGRSPSITLPHATTYAPSPSAFCITVSSAIVTHSVPSACNASLPQRTFPPYSSPSTATAGHVPLACCFGCCACVPMCFSWELMLLLIKTLPLPLLLLLASLISVTAVRVCGS